MSVRTVVLRSAAEMPVRRAELGVDRHRERGALALGVLGARHHQRELELVEAGALHRQADHAARVADHERHLLGRHPVGRDDEVALVLAVFVVDDHDELTAPHGVDGSLDFVERHGVASCLVGATSASTYLAIRSASRFTRAPGGRLAERRDRERVRDQRDRERVVGRGARR